jgi:hypothetical protein
MRLNYIICLFTILIVLSESTFINYHNNINKNNNKQISYIKQQNPMKLFDFDNDLHKIQTIILLIFLHNLYNL